MEIIVDFGGRSFKLDDRWGTDLVAQQMRSGGYEAPLPMLTLAILSRTGGLFCDIGANNGLYSILACQARQDVTVAAFEPYPPVVDVFKRNIALNGLEARVVLREIALSDEEGKAELFVPDPGHGLLETSCSLESGFKVGGDRGSVEISRMRFDAFERELPQLALIKVDIEGHELAFLKGAKRTLKSHRPLVFAEMLPASSKSFFETTELLDELQYEKFRLRQDMAIQTPFIVIDHAAWNYAFVPHERLALFENCCDSHGLELLRSYR